ncbi:MAG: hypothetical protein ACI9KE_001627 [Polyangiales bacterium]|jgi:hypothetical protein
MTQTAKSYRPGQRLYRALVAAAFFLALLVGLVIDAASRKTAFEAQRPETLAVVRQLGFADLALSSSARWLRVPSQSERSAPLTDAPLSFDTDPAGAVLGPVE